MNERKSSSDADPVSAPTQRDVYRETVADATSALPADAATRDIYQERVSGPAGEQVVQSEHVSVPSAAARRNAGVTRTKQVIYFIFGVINVLLHQILGTERLLSFHVDYASVTRLLSSRTGRLAVAGVNATEHVWDLLPRNTRW